MSKNRIGIAIAAILALALLAGACGDDDDQNESQLPNPASVYCEEQGGTLEIRDEAGGQVGYCVFDDGSECEEWAFMRGECSPGQSLGGETGIANPASVYCEEQGGTLEIRAEAGGLAYCVFDDGSECEEWAFMRGECSPGQSLGGETGIANPASVYCEEQGGTLDLATGMCTFADGSQCEEWAFYRGECSPGQASGGAVLGGDTQLPNPAAVFCEEQGGTSEIVTAADGSQSGVCHFTDGSVCDEWAFFRGDCAPGN